VDDIFYNVFVIDDSICCRSLEEIQLFGYSRIPVYNRKDKCSIIGFLLAKRLIVVSMIDKYSTWYFVIVYC